MLFQAWQAANRMAQLINSCSGGDGGIQL